MKQTVAQNIVDELRQTYDQIAPLFSQTRNEAWPEFGPFIAALPDGSRVADIGCGNGRVRQSLVGRRVGYVGIDFSTQQLAQAAAHQRFRLPDQQFVVGALPHLPLPDQSFDAVFCIAVLHHIPSKAMRQAAVVDLARLLKPGGRLFIMNWNRFQRDFFWLVLKFGWQKIFRRHALDFKDLLLPWGDGTRSRYYHAFTLGEMGRLCRGAGLKIDRNFLSINGQTTRSYWRGRNIVTVAVK